VIIAFDIPHQELVNIKIFDLAGREITQIVNRHLGPGSHRFFWDFRNIATGYYQVKMRIGNAAYSRSVPVVR